MSKETYIILGACSAIAVATTRRLAARGCRLILIARDLRRLEEQAQDLRVRGASDVLVRAMDLVDGADPATCYAALAEACGDISGILIFYGLLGEQERANTDTAHALEIIDVNFRSTAAWVMEGARLLEASRAPRRVLLAVSSVAGDRGRRSNFVYGAAKGGLAILLQGVAHKWAALEHGPRAIVMKLGFVDTPMTAGIEKSGPLWTKPDRMAVLVENSLNKRGPDIYAPWYWRFIMLIVRFTPTALFNRFNL
ncbi:SDR family NAD(P)-dependent oxidoreductase [Maricaulis sp.]|uniref:SDR family NAD(P)-dependent oxidoreductase n=1 Tax=Maricaulis sp. TaxID=1486257 RepID=UPI003A8D1CAF